MSEAPVLLELRQIRAGYGPVDVLFGISLEVRRGEIVCLIGANGAGKSSTLMCISRINPIRGGSIWFDGADVTAERADRLVPRGLAQVPEGRRIFPRLTVLENLEMGAYCRSDADGIARDLEGVFRMFPVLRERTAQLGGTLSGGEQQMLAIGRALMGSPRLLMMDEPSMGIAPILVSRIFEAIAELRDRGMTILLVEQNARAALRLSDRGYVLETGRIILSDTGASLLASPKVREAYLGE
ncbi:MAG: ABC transporter ATP-binding protein [Phycisphaerae bacterium]|nr:ABC transporter ATP-binding protein [Phycisphaerae bacterium]